MKRWVVTVIVLYLMSLSIFAVPLAIFLGSPSLTNLDSSLLRFIYIYIIPFLILIETILLLIPFNIVNERPIKRRKVIISAMAGGLAIGFMALMIIASVLLMILGENNSADYIYSYCGLILPVVIWIAWAVIFYKNYKSDDPKAFISNITSWLLKGSILELLVAIPSHIISRSRGECCAPPLTLVGIITGIAIALMSFGPGIFFLYAKRIKGKKAASIDEKK
jgi:hypothetical protein